MWAERPVTRAASEMLGDWSAIAMAFRLRGMIARIWKGAVRAPDADEAPPLRPLGI